MRNKGSLHPLEHHPSYRAVIAAAPPVAELAREVAADDLVATLAVACGDLALGFAAPPGSRRRVESHHRAWQAVRAIDRVVARAGQPRDPKRRAIVDRARRAIDKADVLIAALPGVLPS